MAATTNARGTPVRPVHYIWTGAVALALASLLGVLGVDGAALASMWVLCIAGAAFLLIGCIAQGIRVADDDRERSR